MSTLATDLLEVACSFVVTALFYDLFKPVNRTVSLIAAFLSLIGCATQAIGCVLQLAVMVVSGAARHLSVFGVPALMFLGMRTQVFRIALVFFGLYCLVLGYLIYRSAILPRIVSALIVCGGLVYMTNRLAAILWLIVIAVSAPQLKEQAL